MLSRMSGLQLMGSIVDQQIFAKLVATYLPTLSAHLEKIGIPVGMLALPWFMCFFIGYVPWDCSLRAVDAVFAFGPNVLFQIGLAVLQLNEKKLLAVEEGEKVAQLIRNSDFTPNALMEVD